MGLFSRDSGGTEPSFSDRWTAQVEDGIQQWEYAMLDLREQPSGFFEHLKESTGSTPGPSADALNELGKEGWELVGTIEGSVAADGSMGKSRQGSKTNILIFKRPVNYTERDGKERG